MNLALRGGRGAFLLEKWYADVLSGDGSVLLVYLGWMRVLGVPVARFSAELFRPGGASVRGDAPVRSIEGGESRLEFGPARIDGESLVWSTPGLSGALRFAARHPTVTLREPFLEQGGQRVLWTVEVPDADVEGELRWPGGGERFVGRGYRDRVFCDVPPWRFPVRELRWGRAVSASHAAAWVCARTAQGEVAASWRDGRVVADAAEPVALEAERTLVDTRVADIEGLRFGLLRPILRRLTGDPHEAKWAAAARLGAESGRAIHEHVLWR